MTPDETIPETANTVSVSQVEGKTVVVNNKLDGAKKTTLMTIALVIASILTSLRGVFPKYDGIIEIVEKIAYAGAGYALTSPLDIRGVVISKSGLTVRK